MQEGKPHKIEFKDSEKSEQEIEFKSSFTPSLDENL